MSFTKAKRDAIKDYMLSKIAENETAVLEKTIDAFQITRNTYYRYLRELKEQGIISKPSDAAHYKLTASVFSRKYQLNTEKTAFDDTIYMEDVYPLISSLPENVIHIWDYCFSEMMNNVIDHSGASHVTVSVFQDHINTTITISDNGVGLFHKIQNHFHYTSVNEVIIELFKGKLTTDTANHSGEGIFFTSKLADVFAAVSGGKIFSHTNYQDVLQDLDEIPQTHNALSEAGTTIMMRLSNHSQKIAADIFNSFSDVEGGFTKTLIPLKNIYDRYPVSRSQAKRLTHRFESFREVDLDFDGITDIGQGFAHQIFVVYQREHPDISINPVNMNQSVKRMLFHVTH